MTVNLLTKTAPSLAARAINGHDPGKNQAHWLLQLRSAGVNSKKAFEAGVDTLSDETLALLEVAMARSSWIDLEPSPGVFDFSGPRRMLDYFSERGIPYMHLVDHKTFTGTADVGPSDLVADWQIDTAGGGKTLSWANSAVPRLRFEALLNALIDEIAPFPYCCGILIGGETAGFDTAPGGAYVNATIETQINTLWKNVADHAAAKGVYCVLGWNFLKHGNPLASAVTAFNNCLAGVRTDNTILVTPDILLPGSSFHSALNARVYPLFTTNYGGLGQVSAVQSYRRGSSMQSTAFRQAPNHANDKGDPTADAGAHDLNGDGLLDMHEQFIWGRDNLEIDICVWSHVDFPGNGTDTELRDWTWDRTAGQHGDAFGDLFGDGEGVIRQPWTASHNVAYRGGDPGPGLPDSVSAVVALVNAFGFPGGFGPSDDTEGVFFGRTDLTTGDEWTVTAVNVAGVTVTPLSGGSYTVEVDPGVAPGTYSFDWEITSGPSAPESGSKNFDVV